MTESLTQIIVNIFSDINKELVIFIVSLLPILELRGGLIAARLLNINFINAFLICFIGNILPIPFVLLLYEKIVKILRKIGFIDTFFTKLETKTLKKRNQIDKYGYFGLLLFVGIPLPGTGAWTGSLLVFLLNLDKKKSFVYIVLGVLLAGLIMSFISYLLPFLISLF